MSPPSLAVFPEWQNVITWVKMQVYAVFAPIYCETGKGNGVIKGSFTCFGHPKLTQARADIARFLELIIVRVDGSKQETKVENHGSGVNLPMTEMSPGEGDHNPQPPEIEIKLPGG